MSGFFARAGGAFGVNLLSAGLMFFLHIILARIMGGEQYGIYAYVLTWIVVIAMVVKMGFDTALVRFVPEYRKKTRWPLFRGVVQRSRFLCGVLAGAVSTTIFALLASGVFHVSEGMWWTMICAVVVLPLLVETHLVQAVLRGLQEVPKNELPDRVVRPALMLVGVTVTTRLGVSLNAPGVMTIHLCGLLIAYAIAVWWMKQAMPLESRFVNAAFRSRIWLTTALPLAVVAGMHLALANIDILMLGSLSGTTVAGVYSVAARIAVFVIFALTAINAIAAPVIAENFASGSRERLQHLLSRAARLNLIFAVLMAVGFAIFGKAVLGWFGEGFVGGYWALVILCIGHVLNAACGSVGSVMTMTGHERNAAKILVVAVVVNLVGNAALIPIWGMIGAATATALTTAFWNLLMLGFTWRRLGINASALPSFGEAKPA